jgi:hypothetical protein
MNLRKVGAATVATTVFVAGLGAGIGSAGWSSSDAGPVGLRATLAAASEVPKPSGVGAKARGSFKAGLTRQGAAGTLTWRLTFGGLTGKATAAHVHLGKAGKPGGVAVPLCGPCRSGARGTAKVNAKTVRALLNGGAYVNVHTGKNPAGEIRGQVKKGGKPPASGTTGTTETDTTTATETDPPPYPYP